MEILAGTLLVALALYLVWPDDEDHGHYLPATP